MTKLVALVVLMALAFIMVRYNTNAKVQKWVVISLVGSFAVYMTVVVISELMR